MGTAKYIGRVGALAVALGVGAAIANTPGVALADPSDSGSTSSSSASDSSSKSESSSTSGQRGFDVGFDRLHSDSLGVQSVGFHLGLGLGVGFDVGSGSELVDGVDFQSSLQPKGGV